MPEIAEVARIVHFLRQSLVGKTLAVVNAPDDTIVFGKVGTSGPEFQKALTGKKVIDAGQQGKYFWLIMSSPPHPVFHFGMTGWFHIRGLPAMHYRPKGPKEAEEWPPKFWKFQLETNDNPKVQAAFVDARRLARIRLVDCPAEEIRKNTPLKENGPDPIIDKDIFTFEWFEKLLMRKRVPVKALLLDQANISGIGNWVGDEVLYHSKLHPEQYSNTFSSDQLKRLHSSIIYVCKTAIEALGDSDKFPEDWLFKHRWGKGKKDSSTTLPNGAKITFITVGGRTSCVVPSIQKKTGEVKADVEEDEEDDKPIVKKVQGSKKRRADDEATDINVKSEPASSEGVKKSIVSKQTTSSADNQFSVRKGTKKVEAKEVPKEQEKPKSKRQRRSTPPNADEDHEVDVIMEESQKAKTNKKTALKAKPGVSEPSNVRRRSGRLSTSG